MKKKFILILIVAANLFTGCNTNESINRLYTISIDTDSLTSELSYYDFFEEVKLIPLETNENCLIKEENKTVYENGVYYVMDRRQGAVFAFDSTGKFQLKIHNIGKGPGEYLALEDFNINPDLNTIDVLSPMGKILQYHKQTGEFLKSYNIPNVKAVHAFNYISSDTIILYQYYEENNILLYSFSQQKSLNIAHNTPLFVHRYIPSFNTYHPFFKLNNNIFLFEYFSNEIKVFNKNKKEFQGYLNWDFGINNFDILTLKPNVEINYYLNYISNNPQLIRFANYAENDKQIITQFIYQKFNHTLIFDKRTKRYFFMRKFREDVVFPDNPKFVENELFIVTYPPFVKYYIIEDDLSIEQRNILRNIKKEDNPVIIKYKLNSKQW